MLRKNYFIIEKALWQAKTKPSIRNNDEPPKEEGKQNNLPSQIAVPSPANPPDHGGNGHVASQDVCLGDDHVEQRKVTEPRIATQTPLTHPLFFGSTQSLGNVQRGRENELEKASVSHIKEGDGLKGNVSTRKQTPTSSGQSSTFCSILC